MDYKTCLNSLLDAATILQEKEDNDSCGNIVTISSHQDSSTANLSYENARTELKLTNSNRTNHNILERHRRAQLRRCFNMLRDALPGISGRSKASNVTILKEAIREIQELKEKDLSLNKEKLKLRELKEKLTEELKIMKNNVHLPTTPRVDYLKRQHETQLDNRNIERAIVSCCSPINKSYFITQNIITADAAVNTDFPDDDYVSSNEQISILQLSSNKYLEDL